MPRPRTDDDSWCADALTWRDGPSCEPVEPDPVDIDEQAAWGGIEW